MSTRLFGTDGIRGLAGEFPLNRETIVAIGAAIGEKLGGKILVGQDTRVSSPWISRLIADGIAKTPASIDDAGVIPTPAIALLVKNKGYAGGIMISASHNPYEDNGIKIFSADGTKLKDVEEDRIERRVLEQIGAGARSHADVVPASPVTAENRSPFPGQYTDMLLSHFTGAPAWLSGKHVVTDCANGAMSEVAPAVLARLGARVTVIHGRPTGKNINDHCGAVHLESLVEAMKSHTADFGVAFDGDGDRSLFVTRSGRIIDGDAVLLMMARRLKREGRLRPAAVIGTLMTNFSLEKMLRSEGIALTRVAVGDRYIFEEMQRSGTVLGGEPSGHVIFSDFRLSGDGLLTTLKVAETMVQGGATMEDLTQDWIESPQLLKNVRVKKKVALEELPAVQAKLGEVARELEGCGRLVVRYSGTEPLLRVMIESDEAARNDRLMNELLAVIRENVEVAS
jgi:phosphoglucosamine mutase